MSKETVPEFPYVCQRCGTDLGVPGAVIAYEYLPGRMSAHLEPGEGDGVNLVVDNVSVGFYISLQCFECGEVLEEEAEIEDVYADPNCEVGEEHEPLFG